MDQNDIRKAIESGKISLGIEFGSTRIKAVLIGEDHTPLASGSSPTLWGFLKCSITFSL